MRSRRWLATIGVIGLTGVLLACGADQAVSPTQPDLGGLSLTGEKKPTNPGGGGGKKSTKTPVVTTFQAGGDLDGDGGGPYFDGVDGVESYIDRVIEVDQTLSENPPRTFFVSYDNPRFPAPALGQYQQKLRLVVWDEPYAAKDLAVGQSDRFLTRIFTRVVVEGEPRVTNCRFGREGAPMLQITRESDTRYVLESSAGDWCALKAVMPKQKGKGSEWRSIGGYDFTFTVTFDIQQ